MEYSELHVVHYRHFTLPYLQIAFCCNLNVIRSKGAALWAFFQLLIYKLFSAATSIFFEFNILHYIFILTLLSVNCFFQQLQYAPNQMCHIVGTLLFP